MPGLGRWRELREAEATQPESGTARMRTLGRSHLSRDESLINFSNRHIYQNRLVTFPVQEGLRNFSCTRQTRIRRRWLRGELLGRAAGGRFPRA
jgi:hypothetical protein